MHVHASQFLKAELEPYVRALSERLRHIAAVRAGARYMPTRKQLNEAGRHDLVKIITQVSMPAIEEAHKECAPQLLCA